MPKEIFTVEGNPRNSGVLAFSGQIGGMGALSAEVRLTGGVDCPNSLSYIMKYCINLKNNDVPLVFEHDILTESQIPVMLCYPKGAEKLPLAFFVHGFSVDKFCNLAEGIRIAQRGYFTVVPDARCHGERKIADFSAHYSPDRFVKSFFHTVKGTAEDISMLIDHFTGDSRVDTARVGLTGISMGGFVTFMAGTLDKRITTLAPIVGSPDWSLMLAREQGSTISPEEREAISKADPAINYERFKPSALFVQNGSLDTVVPAEGSRRLDAKLKKLYSDRPDRYEYYEDPSAGHDVPFEMMENVLKWFERHL